MLYSRNAIDNTVHILIRGPKTLAAQVKRTARKTRLGSEREVIRQALFIGLSEPERRMSPMAATPAYAGK